MKRLYDMTIPEILQNWKDIPVWDYCCLLAVMFLRILGIWWILVRCNPTLGILFLIYAHLIENNGLKGEREQCKQ